MRVLATLIAVLTLFQHAQLQDLFWGILRARLTFWRSLLLQFTIRLHAGIVQASKIAIRLQVASIKLGPQPPGSNQDSAETNLAVLPGQGPQRASIARDRSQKSTQGKYSKRGKRTGAKLKIGLHQRLQFFPNEHLCLRGVNLFCNACHELLSTKK